MCIRDSIKGGAGQLAVLGENGADEVAINAASTFDRKVQLLNDFDNGQLLKDMFAFWEAQFAPDQQAASDEFMRYATSAQPMQGGDTNIEVTVVQSDARSKVQETRNALQVAREISKEVQKVR